MIDGGFQPRDGDPSWNESSFLTMRIPEIDLMGIFYYYFRPNQKTAMGGPLFFDRTGEDLSTCLHNGWDWNMALPDGADMFDFQLENSFRCRTVSPQTSYELSYDGRGCSFRLQYDAHHQPLGLDSHADPELGAYFAAGRNAEVVRGHYDQLGAFSGDLTLNGRDLKVAGAAALRDRSWGPRSMVSSAQKPRGSYLFAALPNGDGFQATVLSDRPSDSDPFEGTTETVRSGLLNRNGLLGALVSGTRTVTHRGPDGRPLREVLAAVDEHGREFRTEGTVRTHLRWPGVYGSIMAFWCYETWDLFGQQDVPGEHQEFLDNQAYRDWHLRREGTR